MTQPDSIVPEPGNPQALNRYSYVSNSPVNFNDPSGHGKDCGIGMGCVADPSDEDGIVDGPGGGGNDNGGSGGESWNDDKGSGGGGGNDGIEVGESPEQNCSWNGAFGGGGCDLQYFSLALGLDAPTLMMLSGLGISYFAPEVGVPLALTGAVFEVCSVTATPLCAAVKLASVNVVGTIDKDGNIYVGPQLSWGKSILPFVAVSFNSGIYPTTDGHIATEAEMEDSLRGFAVSIGTIATGGISYSPFTNENKTAYYFVGAPEVFSVNVQYNWLIGDILP